MLNLSQASLKWFVIYFLLIVTASIAVRSQVWVEEANGWTLGDWLINYASGFVRRGLIGSIILSFSDVTSFSPLRITHVWQIALYLLAASIFFALIFRRTIELWFVLFIFSPATFLFPLLDIQGGGRKEILYLVLLAAWCLHLDRRENFSLGARFAFTLVVALMMLSHDGLLFFIPFFPAAYVISRKIAGQRIFAGQAIFLPVTAFLIFVLVAVIGDISESHQKIICDSLTARGIPNQICGGSITWPQDIRWNIGYSIANLKVGLLYPLSFFLAVLPIAVMLISNRGSDTVQIRGVFLIPLFSACILFTIPLYFLGIDFGRWIYVTSMSLMLITIPLLHKAHPKPVTSQHVRVSITGVLFIGIYASTWAVPHCCGPGLSFGGGLLGRILQ